MLDEYDFENRSYLNALSKKRKRAFFSLTIENITRHSWRLFFWILLFSGLWMLGLPQFLGVKLSIGVLLLFLIGCTYLIKVDILSFRFPSDKNLDRLIESRSNLPRGHISLLEDELANPKKHETRALWNSAQHHILHSMTKLKAPRTRAFLSKEDPSALRYLALLVFICGVLTSGSLWKERIFSGLVPISPSYALSNGKTTSLWIKPPDYTQIGQIHIMGNGTFKDVIDIPEGSELRARTHSVLGSFFAPKFQNGNSTNDMTYLDDDLYEFKGVIDAQGDRLAIKQMIIPRAQWTYNFIKDTPPIIYSGTKTQDEILSAESTEQTDTLPEADNTNADKNDDRTDSDEVASSHEILNNAQIRFPLIVEDDYGVKELVMTMNIDDIVEDLPLGDFVQETRLIMSQPNTEFKIAPVYDLSWHTWAGLPVTFEYEAVDHKGQIATLEKINVILPEREFKHPMAQSLIAARKRLAWDYKDSFRELSYDLETLLSAPDYFQNDPVIYLAIRTASSRLKYSDAADETLRIETAKAVINLLWYAAITIEDGNLSLAMRELKEAQRALENAMRDPNASDDEIAQLMDNLRQKMTNYFAEMQRDLQKRMENGEDFPEFSADDFGEMISPDSLAQLMEDIEKALREGDEQKAQELMSQLQRMMEMMDPSMQQQLPSDMQAMKDGVNELQELIERQEQLLEQTRTQAKNKRLLDGVKKMPPRSSPTIEDMLKEFGMSNAPPAPESAEDQAFENTDQSEGPSKGTENTDASNQGPKVDTQANKAEQEALRYILGQLMMDTAEKIDEIPESMGLAEQEMRGSSHELEQTSPRGSIPHQEQAIEHLKDSQEQLSQQFRQRMQQMVGVGLSSGQRYDPLGRPLGGKDDPNGRSNNSDVKVPDEAEKKRADEILRELRDRSGDRSGDRSQDELDYYRRLLRQF